MIWRRILNDPSQTPRDFVAGWMYRPSEQLQDTPPQMLLGWVARHLGLSARPQAPLATTPVGQPLMEPYGVPYEEVTRADLELWLSRALFGEGGA